MALARTALALAPFFLKRPSGRPGKRLAGVVVAILLMVLTGLFLLFAGFTWLTKTYGMEFGFLGVAGVLFLLANIVYFASRGDKVKPEHVEGEMKADPIARFIPDSLQDDPRLQGLMEKIQDHPMGSAAAAVSLGFILTSQLFGDEET